jgi:hypothetical protein
MTGGSGLIGSALTDALLAQGYRVSHLSRGKGTDPRIKTYIWDIEQSKIDEHCIDDIDIVIHLAGAGIADKRWTDKQKKIIIDSRTYSIQLIYSLIKNRPNKVNTIISAAAIGYYGDRGDELLTEDSPPGTGFMPECCIAWENAVDEGKALGLRIVKFRTGVVLDKNGGALRQMARPVKLYAGSAFGSGRQWVPWIHHQDVTNMYLHAVKNIQLQGTFNMVAPSPITNKQLIQAIARQLHKPLWLPNIPAFVFKLLMGEMSIIVLGSTRVSAQKIRNNGFTFQHPELTEALKNIYG